MDEREVTRSLDPWLETEIGRFHQRLSLVLLGLSGCPADRDRRSDPQPPRRRCTCLRANAAGGDVGRLAAPAGAASAAHARRNPVCSSLNATDGAAEFGKRQNIPGWSNPL
jgi:hypothetical protein